MAFIDSLLKDYGFKFDLDSDLILSHDTLPYYEYISNNTFNNELFFARFVPGFLTAFEVYERFRIIARK